MEKQITLPSGKTATIAGFKGKHIREAQKMAGGDEGKLIYALIAQTTKIDDKPVVMEDIDEMNGPDVLALMGEFGGNFSPAKS